jgi:hypothetical protein
VPGSPPTDQQARAQARRALCTELAALLHAASQTDEEQENNGNSSRLLHLASESAQRAALLGWSEPAPESEIYDVAALMSAATRVPGDIAGPERTALVAEAWALLQLITGSESRADIDDAQMGGVQPEAELNAAQLALVLESLAGNASTLCELIRIVQKGSDDQYYALDAALIVAVSIGERADAAVGSSVIGDAHEWHYGPNFKEAGKTDAMRGAA